MESAEQRELRILVQRIKGGNCVLVLGPRVSVRPDDPDRAPLEELLAAEILASAGASTVEMAVSSTNLRRAADLHYRLRQDVDELQLLVKDFYEREAATTTDFHRDLAELPFRLCISASPDDLMLHAFQKSIKGKTPQKGYYDFSKPSTTKLVAPTEETPLIYHLFGHCDQPGSLVLTEGDLIQFLVSIVKGTPPVPDQVRSIVADPQASFLFLGFGFHHWYLRVLLQVMNVYGHHSKAIAFEDQKFFEHPEHKEVVGFFSGARMIDIRPLRWDTFAQQLRETYEASAPKAAPPPAPVLPPDAPLAFISYAREDAGIVEELSRNLQERGIRVWQDKQNLRGGEDWNQRLLDVINHVANYVIVVQTRQMLSRERGVFHREIDAAEKVHHEMGEFEGQQLRFLIPVRFGDCSNLSALSSSHVIDMDEPDGLNALAASILEDWKRRAALKASRAVA